MFFRAKVFSRHQPQKTKTTKTRFCCSWVSPIRILSVNHRIQVSLPSLLHKRNTASRLEQQNQKTGKTVTVYGLRFTVYSLRFQVLMLRIEPATPWQSPNKLGLCAWLKRSLQVMWFPLTSYLLHHTSYIIPLTSYLFRLYFLAIAWFFFCSG